MKVFKYKLSCLSTHESFFDFNRNGTCTYLKLVAYEFDVADMGIVCGFLKMNKVARSCSVRFWVIAWWHIESLKVGSILPDILG